MKLLQPTYTITLPNNKTIEVRPYTVGEQKVLLQTAESGDLNEITKVTQNLLQSCIISDVNVKTLPTYICEYIFLKLRIFSTGSVQTYSFKHRDDINLKGEECKHVTNVNVNLDAVKINFPDGYSDKIQLNDNTVLLMNEPSFGMIEKYVSIITKNTDDRKPKEALEIMASHLNALYAGENATKFSDINDGVEFLESLTETQFNKVVDFFTKIPKLKETLKYKCPGCGQEDEFVLEGLQSFF